MVEREIIITNIAGFDIKLIKKAKHKYDVVYGKEKHLNLTYEYAAKQLGYCIMHALTCADKLEES